MSDDNYLRSVLKSQSFDSDDEEPQGYFSSLFESEDCCPACDSGPLLLRSNGYVCPNTACRKLVFKHQNV